MIKIKKGSGVGSGNTPNTVSESPVERQVEALAENTEEQVVAVEEIMRPAEVPQAETPKAAEKKRRLDFIPKLGREAFGQTPHEDGSVRPTLHKEVKPLTGWVSPNYTVSRTVNLDPATLSANRCILHLAPDSLEVDAYRVLRTKILQKCKEKGGNSIMITSALPGEGKTLTSINIAVTLAKELMQTVLLVDCDLRRQSIHQYLGYPSDKGLIDYLLNDTPVSELVTWPGIEKLTVLSGGRPISGSSELLGSERMKELVEDMKHRYPERYIIFDVPPLLAGADALTFIPLVDHVVVVARDGVTSAQTLKQAMKMIPPEKVLGLVLNGHKSPSSLVQYSLRKGYPV